MPRRSGGSVGHVVADSAHAPGARLWKPAIVRSKRGLAAAGRAEHRDELARRDREVDAVQHHRRAIAGAQLLHLDRGRIPHPCLPARTVA